MIAVRLDTNLFGTNEMLDEAASQPQSS